MPTFDARTADLSVYTYKEGLLSAVAHDLHLRAHDLELVLDEAQSSVALRVVASSLQVVSAMQDDRPAPGVLSASDTQKIEANMRDDVLHTRRYPEIRFVSEAVEEVADGVRVTGVLDLHGVQRRLEVPVRSTADTWIAEVRLHQPDFRIKPFSAMLGSLKVAPEVWVRLRAAKHHDT